MVTDEQVRLLRRKRMEGKTMEAAAAAAGMSERSARKWQEGPFPSQAKADRGWRTRPDPFVEVWTGEVVPLLEQDENGRLEAKTIFDELVRRHPGKFQEGQLRTLQRRVRDWRAISGPEREVFFPQEHAPGQMGAFDFTDCRELGVTIAGQPFAHLLFHLVLAYSGWHFVKLAFSETFEALLSGLQSAFVELGGVPAVVRLDNLSAATHELREKKGRGLTERFQAIVDHYGFLPAPIRPGRANENGVVEKGHHLVKSALQQALLLRGHRDFPSVDAYMSFVRKTIGERLHRGRESKFAEDLAAVRPLPASRLPEYTQYKVKVRKWSTINLNKRIYSVPSRLIDYEVEARLFHDVVEVWYGGKLLETMPRLRGGKMHRIDYRHIAWSLARKPGAFRAYRFREELFPTLAFRRAYDALVATRGDRADVEYVRILHLAASTMEYTVEEALEALLEDGKPFDFAAVQALAKPEEPAVPSIEVGTPDLSAYDSLLAVGGGS